MTVGKDLQADLKKSKTRVLASARFAELGGTFTLRSVNAIWVESPSEAKEELWYCFYSITSEPVSDEGDPERRITKNGDERGWEIGGRVL